MSAFAPENYAEAVLTHKAMRRARMTPSLPENGKTSPRSDITRQRASNRKAKRAKRTKLPTRKKLVAELDSLTSQIVRLRDGQCVLCHSTERLQCGHLFGRRSHGARWDIEPDGNCHCQCAGCNQRHNYDPNRYFTWYRDWHGEKAFNELYKRWSAGRKYSRLELIALVAEYKAHLESAKQSASTE